MGRGVVKRSNRRDVYDRLAGQILHFRQNSFADQQRSLEIQVEDGILIGVLLV